MQAPRAIPEGTITFLFTDIEGSTRLWEESPEGMRVALMRHDDLVRRAIERNAGYIFKTIGDAFCAAFDTATNALNAVLEAQRALQNEPWPVHFGEERALRARMALHTGDAQERGGDYFGPSVNRVARILSAGHGGQMLLSLTTTELVRDNLPPGVTLRDMGERRLRDLIRPEWIHQLTADGLLSTFPPLRTLDGRRHNLPVQSTALVGRERELEEVRKRLLQRDTRLLTLTGPGGTGKTRLSLQVAADLVDDFEHGVFFVPLAPVTDPALVPAAIARVLEVKEEPGRSTEQTVIAALREQHALLVLDNLEQVLDAGGFIAELLEASPRVRALASSRSPLRIYGEREYVVPALRAPDPKRLPPLERLATYDAVRLFIDRATDVHPDFQISEQNAPSIVEICHRLDGLPLAIELAAARVKLLSPAQLLERLQRPLDVLTGGARNLPPRQQTLRNLIAWSYDLLPEEQRHVFSRLSVFAGSWTLESGTAVVGTDEFAVLEGLGTLVEMSLVRREDLKVGNGTEIRFSFLETILAFAREKLQAGGETAETQRRHAEYFLALSEAAEPALYGPDQLRWLHTIELDHANFRVAQEFFQSSGELQLALRLASGITGFWRVRGHLQEGRARLEQVLNALALADVTPAYAAALAGAGTLAGQAGDVAEARLLFERSLAAWQKLGNDRRATGVRLNLGTLALRRGDYDAARELFEEALAVQRSLGITAGVVISLNNLGLLHQEQGNLAAARECLEESLAIKRRVGDLKGLPPSLVNLATLALLEGNQEEAAQRLVETLSSARDLGDPRMVAHGLESSAELAAAIGEPARAFYLAGAATALRESIHTPIPASDARRLNAALGMASDALSAEASALATAQGKAAAIEDVMTEAIAFCAGAAEKRTAGVTA